MSKFQYHETLRLQNFTAFSDSHFEFIPGVNIFVGENGTGKTHAMKAAYAFHLIQSLDLVDHPGSTIFRQIFQLSETSEVLRDSSGPHPKAIVSGKFGGNEWEMSPEASGGIVFRLNTRGLETPVFFPATDMMAHTKGFVSLFDQRAIDFDRTYREIVSMFFTPELRELDNLSEVLADRLIDLLGGNLVQAGERFFIEADGKRRPMYLVAEGLRKISTLLQLVRSGWLKPGTTLFWDEPEANLNPRLMDEVAKAILMLARNGVQVFLATHSYLILEELKDAAGPGEVRYFGFEPSPDGVKVSWTDELPMLSPNAILDQYEDLGTRKLKKALAPRLPA